ncbi:hypothetical protein PR202_gb18742 [Eleusine coracana subsp. coracana]|uniref:DUF1618 domain-containing protein n=1 Tax=Eleusine coracana subsp. coracana TaxID=191504 RepID=A0AAV5F438_ELECO|nr:hypothetical protein QOZ80_3BG0292510 [Eleusine coracana subsp. coracana]GJN30434.1 hypothetical protein PR202_gb18742 [Eleusine coracana subsp. coracana]
MSLPGSLNPPALPILAAASRRPGWILLDQDAYIAGRTNATTAATTLPDGRTFEVSFWATDPPAVSHLCARIPGSRSDATDFGYEPRVVGAEGRFVLIRVRFTSNGIYDELFMYRADPDSPTLEQIPLPRDYRLPLFKAFGIAPRGDGGHYLVAALGLGDYTNNQFSYQLHIYSSEDQTWSVKPLPDSCPGGCGGGMTQKLITLGEGVLGWVNFHRGVLVCDVFRKSIDARFIPFPQPMPENRVRLKEFHPGDPAFRVRDVAVSNGVIKFVEIEHRCIVTTILPEKPIDPSVMDVLYDSDLIASQKRMDDKPRQVRTRDGWRAVTWTRAISSNCWHKGRVVDVDDISVDDAMFSSLVSELGVVEHEGASLKFRDL